MLQLESFFSPTNDNVEFRPSRLLWAPFPLPIERGLFRTSNGTTFLRGIRTVAGTGDPIRGDGLALHVYTADVSMTKEAFANNDGDLLILPEKGRLSIQTELGRLMVRPGELVVIPAGIRFRVQLPDGPVRGYIQEIFGAHYEPTTSPDDSPSSGFEHPVASFDLDESSWNITYKLAGALQEYLQDHSPFDVVAWHGNLVPFKYAIDNLTSGNRHRSGVTLDCVLTAPSRLSGVSIAEFLVLNLKHTAGPHVGPPTHCHRKSGTEIMGLLHGRYGDNPYTLEPGGLSYEASYMPHRDIGDLWHDASIHEPEDDQQCLDTTAFLFQCSAPLLLTRWAVRGDGAKLLRPCVSDQRATVRAQFLDHFDEVNADLQAAGLPTLPRQTRSHR